MGERGRNENKKGRVRKEKMRNREDALKEVLVGR